MNIGNDTSYAPPSGPKSKPNTIIPLAAVVGLFSLFVTHGIPGGMSGGVGFIVGTLFAYILLVGLKHSNFPYNLIGRLLVNQFGLKLDLGLEPEKLVGKVPFFADLDEVRINEIAALLKPRLLLPGELVVRRGDPGNAMYFISTGAVEVDIPNNPVRLGSGDFFGEIALLKEMSRTANVTALSNCQVLALFARDFKKLLDANPELRDRFADEALAAHYD